MSHWNELSRLAGTRILGWAADQPWARAMAGCVQDSGWHAEGDVWTHTSMVAAELERLSGWENLGESDRAKLTFAALFHDVGKPATTQPDPETGRMRSPKHAVVGVEIARRVLRDLGC